MKRRVDTEQTPKIPTVMLAYIYPLLALGRFVNLKPQSDSSHPVHVHVD